MLSNPPWRLIGLVAMQLACLLLGVYITANHYTKKYAKQRAADQQVVAEQLAANAIELRKQIQTTRDIEAKYAQLQAANAAANAHLRNLLRDYANRPRPMPDAPNRPGLPDDTSQESRCTRDLSELVNQSAPVFDAARDDATKLAELQAWIIASGMQ